MDEYIKRMVDEFLSWTLPTDFVPDAGIRFYPPDAQYAHSWPTGTNLFTADQARTMFEHCAATLIEDLVRKDADCHSNGRRVTELESELARVREERDELRALLDEARGIIKDFAGKAGLHHQWARDVISEFESRIPRAKQEPPR